MKSPLRIAVADDEPELRKYFTVILPRLGHEVVSVAANGQELLEQCLALRPDLIITDVTMPQLDGLTATRTVARTYPVAVMVVSGYDDDLTLEPEVADHIQAHLIKPFTMAQLNAGIELAIQRFAEQQRGPRVEQLPAAWPDEQTQPAYCAGRSAQGHANEA